MTQSNVVTNVPNQLDTRQAKREALPSDISDYKIIHILNDIRRDNSAKKIISLKDSHIIDLIVSELNKEINIEHDSFKKDVEGSMVMVRDEKSFSYKQNTIKYEKPLPCDTIQHGPQSAYFHFLLTDPEILEVALLNPDIDLRLVGPNSLFKIKKVEHLREMYKSFRCGSIPFPFHMDMKQRFHRYIEFLFNFLKYSEEKYSDITDTDSDREDIPKKIKEKYDENIPFMKQILDHNYHKLIVTTGSKYSDIKIHIPGKTNPWKPTQYSVRYRDSSSFIHYIATVHSLYQNIAENDEQRGIKKDTLKKLMAIISKILIFEGYEKQ